MTHPNPDSLLMNRSTPSRREFVRLAAGAAALAGTGLVDSVLQAASTGAAPAPKGAFKLRYVLSTNLYGTLPIAEIVPEVHATGCEGLDVWAGRWGNQREQIDALGHERFAAMLKERAVKVSTYTCMDPGFPKSEPHIHAMKRFGGDTIVAGFGGGGPGAKDLRGDELRRAIRGQVEKLKPIFAKAGELGVKLAIENHLNGLLEPVEGIMILAEELPEKHVGIALAPLHLPQDATMLGKLVGDLGEKILYYYAWQRGDGSGDIPPAQQKKQLPGVGPLDFTPMLAALQRGRYEGWTSIFMHPTPRGAPMHPTVRECTAEWNRARAYLDGIVAKL